MKTLLWKDYRVNRQVLIVGFCLLVAPYLAAVSWIWYDRGLTGAGADYWAGALAFAAQASLICSQMTLVLLAGYVIAGERRDRSAEFLAYLPPSRSAILTSKSLLSAAVVVVVWGLYLLFAEVVVPALSGEAAAGQSASFAQTRPVLLAVGVTLFGMAWLGSSMLESPTYSAAIGVLAVMLLPIGLNLCHTLTGLPAHGDEFVDWLRWLYFALGTGGFIAGWMYYVRRVEP
jgi:ABC-type transport system involved in multi-copper enzyme maturation permease subunit